MNRIDRLVAVLISIQSKKSIELDELAEKYGVSKRTIYRDVKALGEAGVPIYTEDNRRYRIMEGYYLPPVMVTRDEATALLIMEKLAGKYSDKSLQEQFRSLATKIKAVLRYADKEYLASAEESVLVYTGGSEYYGYKETKSLMMMQKAIAGQKLLCINYRKEGEQQATEREIEPIGITQYGIGWHLIGWCRLRKAYRDFRLDRIVAYNVLDKGFEPREKEPLKAYLASLAMQ